MRPGLVIARARVLLIVLWAVLMMNGCALLSQDGGETTDVILYFGKISAMESGVPGEFGFVTPVVRTVSHDPDHLEAALRELIRGPLPEDGDVERTLPARMEVVGTRVENGVLTIDVCSSLFQAPDGPAGTLGGAVFVQSLLWTTTEIPGIEAIIVTVEGEAYEDGHFVWDEPLGRNSGP